MLYKLQTKCVIALYITSIQPPWPKLSNDMWVGYVAPVEKNEVCISLQTYGRYVPAVYLILAACTSWLIGIVGDSVANIVTRSVINALSIGGAWFELISMIN